MFDAFKKPDENTVSTIERFKIFVKGYDLTRPAIIKDNRYHLNLIHLICTAFDVLRTRGQELPAINRDDRGGVRGKLANQFCFTIIGAILETDLPHRVKQILRMKNGIFGLFRCKEKPSRELDVSGSLFRSVDHGYGRVELGVNFHYDDFGIRHVAWSENSQQLTSGVHVQNLLRAMMSSASKMYDMPAANARTASEPVSENVAIRRSPAAIAAAR